ncbi:MAG: glycosyl hydrolase family 15 [Gammaproteobacteria bacterium]|nr:glycosyl hydrolase family 15 [Gammaproteobacteria bacterium]
MDRKAIQQAPQKQQRQLGLDRYYRDVQSIILTRQNPITGLLPASTAVTVHGDYTDAWVRDNVYSILAPWGLAIAYRRAECDSGRAYALEQSVVKLMRGLLICMMKQSDKVEAFKHTLNPMDALHAKYNTQTGDPVVGDDEWGHLQLDATSIFLLMLAQMTASGLRIIFNQEEVNFVQNLVHYISRAYLTPDFGLWERGAKSNEGNAEINASSVGMAKAALEAMRGFDLYGTEGNESSVIHVVEDDIANARDTLEALLPRESASKEIDAALLSIIGFPAYAVENEALVNRTRQEIVDKLQGRYGCKRFLRDGHQTVVEDHERLYYKTGELQAFEDIESEWPLFFTYLLLDGQMRMDEQQANFYQQALEPLFVEQDGQKLLPELYYVAAEHIEAEKAAPHSQPRLANENVPLVWAQSLSILSSLLQEKYLYPSDIDPLDRRWQQEQPHKNRLLVTLLAENSEVRAMLHELGIASQTPQQIAPIQVASSSALARAFTGVGSDDKLSLSGRPLRQLDTLTTSQIYTLRGEQVIFLPPFIHTRHSYFQLDNYFLVEQIRAELGHIQRNWRKPGRPLLSFMITRAMLSSPGHELLTALLQELQAGDCNGVSTRVARITEHLPTASRENIDYLHDFAIQQNEFAKPEPLQGVLKNSRAAAQRVPASLINLWSKSSDEELLQQLQLSTNAYAQVELISILWERLDSKTSTAAGRNLRDLAEELYHQAAQWRLWGVMRRTAALLGWYDERLQDELARLVIRGIRVAVGRSFSDEVLIVRPLGNAEIMERINTYGGDDLRGRLLLQELVLLLGKLVKVDPAAFKNTYTLQCWHLLLLLNGELAWERGITEDEAFEELLELNPQNLMQRLHQLLTNTGDSLNHLASIESLQVALQDSDMVRIKFTPDYNPQLESGATGEQTDIDWAGWRKAHGGVIRLSEAFCAQVWEGFGQCAGIVIGDRLSAQNRLESKIIRADMTPGEKNFALLIEDKLNHIHAPEYRQLVLEALQVVAAILRANPSLKLDSYIVLDVLIGYAVRIHSDNTSAVATAASGKSNADAWSLFFATPPYEVANAIVAAFDHLVNEAAPAEASA